MRRGSAYLFVMIIMFSIFITITLSISSTRRTLQNTFIYAENANQYDLLLDCIERFTTELNEIVHSNRNIIQKNVLDTIKGYIANNPEAYLFYEAGEESIYHGNFYLKQPDIIRNNLQLVSGNANRLFTDLYSAESARILFPVMQNRQPWIYSIDIMEKDTLVQYQVSIRTTIQGSNYSFVATIENLATGITDSISGRIALETEAHSEIFYENYRFKGGMEDPALMVINESVYIQDHNWSKENPVAYFTIGQSIDISAFYEGGDPIPTVLVAEGENHIFYSQPDKNIFSGLLYAKGDLSFAEGFVLQQESDILSISIRDRVFRRKLYDYFGLVDFQSGDIFKFLLPSVDFSLGISALPRYRIVTVR